VSLTASATGQIVVVDPDKPVETPPVMLVLHPAREPAPALRYRLLPELRERQSGNAIPLYFRAFSPEWFIGNEARRDPGLEKKLEQWMGPMPLKELPLKEMEWIANSKSLREVDRAARRTYCDWELADRYREEGIGMHMPDIQAFRQFARYLSLRARIELAQGRYADAAATLRTGFQMARHVCEGPTVIHSLVGAAAAKLMLDRLEELIQQPGAPSFYWPLTDLPRPLIDMRTALQGERLTIDWMYPGARDLLADTKAPPPSPENVRAMFRTVERPEPGEINPAEDGGGLAWLAKGAQTLPEARRALIELGRTPEQVDALPGRVANLLLEVHNFDRAFDDLVKWQNLPYPVAAEGRTRGFAWVEDRDQIKGRVIGGLLVASHARATFASARTDRHVAALRVVEAVRLYAAAHGGKLPAKLTDVTEVPVPDDPVTGKPFGYAVEGAKALLTAPPPSGQQPERGNHFRYELTIAR
jgi:hypothetical protein